MIAQRPVPDPRRACGIATSALTILAAALLLCAVDAGAARLRVTTTGDGLPVHGHRCTLREAIEAVDSPQLRTGCGRVGRRANTIVLSRGRYVLSIPPRPGDDNSSGDLNITARGMLTIAGAGARATVIDAAGDGDRVLSVARGARVVLRGLSITGGRAAAGSAGSTGAMGAGCPAGGAGTRGVDAGGDGSGGGISNAGTLILDRVAVRGNRAGAGGAGGSGAGTGCNGGDGGRGGGGGGIDNLGRLTLTRTTVAGNRAGAGGPGGPGGEDPLGPPDVGGSGGPGGPGGGIDNQGTLTVRASTIARNQAGPGGPGGPGGLGGGGGAGGAGGAGAFGGGVFSAARRLTILNSTLYGNVAGAGGGAGLSTGAGASDAGAGGSGGSGGSGGGIAVVAGPSRVQNATVADNAVGVGGASGPGGIPGAITSTAGAPGRGGGLFVASARPFDDLQLQNTIIASNRGMNCAGATGSAIANGAHDLSYGDRTCPGRHANPGLGPLQDDGGFTATMAIGPRSPATNAVPARGSGCPSTDERGVRRPQGGACDIGAYEFAVPRITILAPLPRGSYERGSRVRARFRCDEGGVANTIASCTGSAADGARIDTMKLGTVPFVVTAIDRSGIRARKVVHYQVWIYSNPLRDVRDLTPRRIDLGVDYAGSGPLLAIGRARVTMASDTDSGPSSCWAISCWPGGGIVVMRLLDGPFAGRYIYVAEHITVDVRAGQIVNAGQQIATLHAGYPWSEWGWAVGPGPEALAMADGHWCHTCADVGDWSTIEGRNMNALLTRLGAPSGLLQPVPSQRMPAGWPVWPG
ncbi:MAG TPA: choice-of-anchor Q domain-containing protein [Solirubrobacteraceae bacterium]|nr:choice-of-anchor Q domain-containing protein [Solirubrobacteraceae bacterium]